jgi:acetyl-CoA C-acetyltransferase
VIGAEIMTQGGTSSATDYLAQMTDCRWEYSLGITFPGMFALMASAHMKEFGTTEEDLALVSCKNHRNALKNEDAQFHKTVSVEDVLGSPPVAPPLKLLDCSPLSDGAAAIILASEEKARTYTDTPVWVRAIGAASSGNLLSQRKHLSSIPSIRLAAMRAFQQSGLSSKDMDFAEVHDCFTIAEIIAYEELGFAERGKGAKLLRDGATEIGGDIPVNASGGLKAKGHPLGATGVGMVVELTRQLRSEVEKSRQIKDAKVGLAQNMGLTGQYSYVSIYSR